MIDCHLQKVHSVVINSKKTTVEFKNHSLCIPKELLLEIGNTIIIEYSQVYNNQGTGLHQYKDPEDQSIYLYTQFESHYAHTFMPCFDQPNLKASLTLTVYAP
jgi:aminopeptidase N